jgi:hypothetical protein
MRHFLDQLGAELESRQFTVRLHGRKGRPPRLTVDITAPTRSECVTVAPDTDDQFWFLFHPNTLIDRATEIKAVADQIEQRLTTHDIELPHLAP